MKEDTEALWVKQRTVRRESGHGISCETSADFLVVCVNVTFVRWEELRAEEKRHLKTLQPDLQVCVLKYKHAK